MSGTRVQNGQTDLSSSDDPGSVLIVDDELDVAESHALVLQKRGLETEYETDPAAAIDRINEPESPVDCVVSDYRMPETNGLELLNEIRQSHPNLPFILFTGRGSEEVASEAIEAGADGYLQKGGTEQYDRLANRIQTEIDRAQTRRSLEKRRQQFEAVFKNAFDGLFILDMESAVIVEANPRACELLGYTYDSLIGTSIKEIHPDDFDEYREVGQEILETGESRRVESVCYTKDNEPLPSDISASTMQYEDKKYLLTIMRPR